MTQSAFKSRRYIVIGIIAVVVIGAIVIVVEGGRALDALRHAGWPYLFGALAAAAVALLFQCWNFVLVSRLLEIDTGLVNLSEIGFTSIAFGNVVSAPFGSTELSVRAALIVPQGYRFGDVATASLAHSYFKDMAILVMVPVITIYQLVAGPVSPNVLGLLLFIVALSVGILLLITAVFVSRRVRHFFLGIIGRLWHFVTHRSARRQLEDLDVAVERLEASLARRPWLAAFLVALMVGDWVATLVCFDLCFHAFGLSLSVPVLITGLVAGKIAAIASLVPGGIGIGSLSAAGAFALFGLNFRVVLLPVVLFRVVYDFVPYVAGFALVRPLLKRIS